MGHSGRRGGISKGEWEWEDSLEENEEDVASCKPSEESISRTREWSTGLKAAVVQVKIKTKC